MLSTIEDVKRCSSMGSKKSQACEAWQLFLKLFSSQRSDLPKLASEFELSPVQCHILHLIEPNRPISMGKIAETLACDASNVTGLIDRLESKGLVRRRPSGGDRRVKVLELTPQGIRLRSTVVERMTRPPVSFERLSADDQRALVKILKHLID